MGERDRTVECYRISHPHGSFDAASFLDPETFRHQRTSERGPYAAQSKSQEYEDLTLLRSNEIEDNWQSRKVHLEGSIKGKIADSIIERTMYATNAGNFELAPVAVVIPENEEDVLTTTAFCRTYGIPLTPRGAGTSVTDAALGSGIVLDLSRNMNSIISLDVSNNVAEVQPGITIEVLNAALAKYGKMLPLYPFKGLTCTVGGCIAVNAGGILSGRYGRSGDMVHSLRAVLADGTVFEYNPEKTVLPGQQAEMPGQTAAEAGAGNIFEGSEGKLGTITAVKIRVADVPQQTKAKVYHFRHIEDALSTASGSSFDFALSSVLADSLLLSAMSYRLKGFSYPRDAEASLIVIAAGDVAWPDLNSTKADSVDDINASMPVLFSAIVDSIHTLSRPVPNGKYTVCVEGFRVGRNALPSFAVRLEREATASGTRFILFAETLGGTVYFRPFLNMRRDEDREKHRRLLAKAVRFAVEGGGTLSTENGFGMQINSLIDGVKKLNGLTQTDAARTIERWSLSGSLDSAQSELETLYRMHQSDSLFIEKPMLNWNTPDLLSVAGRGALEFQDEMEACHGCGECRTLSFMETQCPVYKAMGGEVTSPRGRNNIVRLISKVSEIPTVTVYSEEYRRSIYDYCVQCKMCVLECPSNVNTAKLMMEARAQYVRKTGVKAIGRASKFFSDYEFYTVVASSIASLLNRLIRSGKARSVLEHSFGVDRRRRIPEFDLQTFSEWFDKHDSMSGRKGDLVYFSDVYANYFDSRVGISAVLLLEELGYGVQYPKQRFTGLPLIYLGMLREAKRYILDNVSFLYPYTSKGTKVVCTSPSAVMALRHDYLSVVDDERSKALSSSVVDITELLFDTMKKGELRLKLEPFRGTIYYFPSCHSRALGNDVKMLELLRLIPEAVVKMLGGGCCGAGGSYSFAKETFAMSMEMGGHVFGEVRSLDKDNSIVVTDGEECALQILQGTGVEAELPITLLSRLAGFKIVRIMRKSK